MARASKATRARLKALRKKYHLGEYSPGGKRRRPRPGNTYYLRGKSRTPTITKYKKKIRRAIRKLPGRIKRGLESIGGMQTSGTNSFSTYGFSP